MEADVNQDNTKKEKDNAKDLFNQLSGKFERGGPLTARIEIGGKQFLVKSREEKGTINEYAGGILNLNKEKYETKTFDVCDLKGTKILSVAQRTIGKQPPVYLSFGHEQYGNKNIESEKYIMDNIHRINVPKRLPA